MSTRGIRVWGIAAVAVAAVAIAGCGAQPTVAAGTAALTSENRPIANITGLELDTSGRVEITTGATQSLSVEAPADVLPVLTSEVTGGVLRLSVKDHAAIRNSGSIRYKLTVPTLDRISVEGSGDVRYTDLKAPTLTVDIDGSGDVTLAGTVEKQTVRLSGSGNYSAADLATRSADVSVDGSGGVDVRVADTLKIDIKGSGDVSYRGTPTVDKHVAGSGDITQAQ